MANRKLFLIRHAQATGQAPNAELTSLGIEQAEALVERMGGLGIDSLYASPYRRARATIEPFANRFGFDITVLEDLHERVLLAEDHNWLDHVERSFADFDHKLRGGESLRDAQHRALGAIAEIAGANHSAAAAVSHGNLIAIVLCHIDASFGFHQWRAMRNPDIFEISLDEGRPSTFRRID